MNNIDTTIDIFEKYYWIKIQKLQVMTKEEARLYGNIITGDKKIDKNMDEQWITRQATINDMIDYYKNYVQIRIMYHSDSELIYGAIDRHLNAWIDQLNHSMNVGNAPLEDLLQMDRFAKEIYKHARDHFTEKTLPRFFGLFNTSSISFNKKNFFNSNPNFINISSIQEDHISKEEIIKDKLNCLMF